MSNIEALQDWIDQSRRIVFFGGAGVSTESGIPDFRSADGLYNQQFDEPPERILSHSYFERRPEQFFRFYRAKMLCPNALPNAAHRKLAELERANKLSAVITQNIDGLHQLSGSENVLELHGSVHRNTCVRCGKRYGMESVLKSEGVPRCDCGGVIKPDVVLYEEPLDEHTLNQAVRCLREADLLIVGGTSLVVWPAAGLLRYYGGRHIVLINRDPTPADGSADLIFREPLGQVLSQIRV